MEYDFFIVLISYELFLVLQHKNLYSLLTFIFKYVIHVITYLEFLSGTHGSLCLKYDDILHDRSGSNVGNILNLLFKIVFFLFSSFNTDEFQNHLYRLHY